MRCGCFADAHTGKPAGYPERLAEQEAVLRRAVEVFNREGVDLILFAGDATHRHKPDPAELLAFTRPLLAANAPILAIPGNTHDGGHINGPIALELLDLDEGSAVLSLYRTPQNVEVDGAWISVLPWAPVNRLVASRNGGDRDAINQEAAAHLLTIARELRSQIPEGTASVLLTHFGISGGTDGLERVAREPILPVEELAEIGFDAVVAGHFHRPEELGPLDRDAPIFYCGSPYPLDHSEGGYEHGCWILDVEPGRAEARFVPLPSRRFLTIDLGDDPVKDYETIDEHGWPTDLNKAVVRLRYTATREQAARIDNTEIARALIDAGAHRVTVQPTILPDQRARVVVDEHAPVTDAVGLYLDALDVDDGLKRAMREQHDRYVEETGL